MAIRFACCYFLLLWTYNAPLTAQSRAYFPRSAPEAQGVVTDSILSFIDRVEAEFDVVHSIMVVRHGYSVAEGWWAPYEREAPHIMHSLSKSFTSTAIGFAVQEGLLSLDDLVVSFFPDKKIGEPDRYWNQMRIRDLLTMNTGHAEERWPDANTEDWAQLFLGSDLDFLPGTHFKYNSMATYMLSAILQRATGEKLVDYLDKRLFQPLRIPKPDWKTCPDGVNTGGWGLQIRTEDIARLGQFYLQKGEWEGRQLLAREWVEQATSKQVSNGSDPESDWAQGYGFQFWQCRHGAYRGDGACGQFCIVMPEQDAIIAITSGTPDMHRLLQVVWEVLLPAMRAEPLFPQPEKEAKLRERLSNLKLPLVQEVSTAEARITDGVFQMKPNNASLESVGFHLQEETPHIIFERTAGTDTLWLGQKTYRKGEVIHALPYTENLEPEVAANGGWASPNIYEARVYLFHSPARITYTFQFEGGRLVMKSHLHQALLGRRDLQVLEGRRR
ncbi:MAG: serine hydrolase [Phaeodactylibacter sp.]|uniref:serine hydrolase domain-containing protein n=1 Tax=Phaeodactylibacter sp. TaxID=1940289 RepID=UPI0032ED6A0B